MKYYITQAGIEFLKEDDDSRRRQQRPIPGRRASELRDTPKGRSISNQSKDYAGHEERMQAHMDRIAAKEKLDRKMGRDVNEVRGDHLKKIVIPPLPDEYSSPKYQKKTTTKRYKRRQAEVRAVIKKRGHPDAAKEADLLRMRRNRGVQWRTMHSLTPNQRSVFDIQNSLGRQRSRPDTPW